MEVQIPAIETNILTKTFKGVKAVDSLDMSVPAGSIYGFLGPNGAGKTTTIKMLTGLIMPAGGEIKIFGKQVNFGSLKNRMDIGYLPDVPGFYDWMTASEFLKLSGELFDIEAKRLNDRIGQLLELVGLTGVKKKIGGYSRGMKQRLGIAQALINEPKVVFFDEPTSALDPIGRKEVIEIMAKLAGSITVFFSSHILADIERICDRVMILNKGKVMAEDTIVNLRSKYKTRCIELETDRTAELAEALKRQAWVGSLDSIENGSVKLFVNDMTRAQAEIPGLIHDKGLLLKRFVILEPTLEDIFLKVVNE